MTALTKIREEAARYYAAVGLPTTKQEDWRFTNVAPIAKTRFVPPPQTKNGWRKDRLAAATFPDQGALRLVFVNGRFAEELSTKNLPVGITCGTLGNANSNQKHLARYANHRENAFVAWNTAEFSDGAFVGIPEGLVMSEPIHLMFLTGGSGQPVAAHPRTLVVMGDRSQATLIETYSGEHAGYLANAVTEVVVGEGAVLDHYKVQLEEENSFHVATTDFQLGRDAHCSSNSISLGGRLVRNDVKAVLGKGAHATLDGLYVIGGAQHVDNHTSIEHTKPHGTSSELYKGILDGRSTAVFNGLVMVHPDAQKTDSKQSNKNLVLSEDATINTKPELKIFADDVRCTHGATIGQLDPDAIFYLRSRGIAQDQARDLLTHAFTQDVTERIKVEPLRKSLERRIWEKLG